MSAAARSARASARPAAASGVAARAAQRRRSVRPPLHEVPAPAPTVAGAGVFALVVTGLLVGGMVLLLVLNTSLAQGAFEIGALSQEQRELAVTEQRLLQDVAVAEAPESLQREARRLGMVASVSPVFLRLSDGRVLGRPQPAEGVVRRAPRTVTATTPSRSTSRPTGAAGAAAAATSAPSDAAVADPVPQSDAAVLDEGASR